MLFLLLQVASLAPEHPVPECSYKVVRVAKSSSGYVASEVNRVCVINKEIVTGDNQIYLKKNRKDRARIVARWSSIGKIGLPISWNRDSLIVHAPFGVKIVALNKPLRPMHIVFINDYTDEQMLKDSQ